MTTKEAIAKLPKLQPIRTMRERLLDAAIREALKYLGQGNPYHASVVLTEAIREDENL